MEAFKLFYFLLIKIRGFQILIITYRVVRSLGWQEEGGGIDCVPINRTSAGYFAIDWCVYLRPVFKYLCTDFRSSFLFSFALILS